MTTTTPDHWEIRRRRRREYAETRLDEALKHLGLTDEIFDNGVGVGVDKTAWKVESRTKVYRRMLEKIDGARCSTGAIAMVVGVDRSAVDYAVGRRSRSTLYPERMDQIAAEAFRIAGVGTNSWHTNLGGAEKNHAVWLMRRYQPDGLRMTLAQIAIRTYGWDMHGRPRNSSVCKALLAHERRMAERADAMMEAAA